MDKLPVETIEIIASYLSVSEAKSFSLTFKNAYHGTLIRIWSNARLKYKNGRPFLNVVDIKHLPFKKLYSCDVVDDLLFDLHDLPPTLKKFYIQGILYKKESFMKFRNCDTQILFFG